MKIESVVRAAAAIACGFWLAGTSPATAQTTLANPAAPPELPLRTESVADAPWLPRFQLGPRFVVGVPVGAFGDNVGTSPGATVDFRARLGRTPVSVGAEFGYLLYGSETRRIALFPTVPEVLSDVGTTNNIIRTHALVRVQPRTGRVRPYAEGLLGFNYVYTRTSVDLGEDSGASTTHLGDFARSLGAGGGVTIELFSRPEGRLALDLGLRYLSGGEVDYLAAGDLERDPTGVTFEPSRSSAALISVQIGVSIDF